MLLFMLLNPLAQQVTLMTPPHTHISLDIYLANRAKQPCLKEQNTGAGIVADSDPAYEQKECEAKASALLAAAKEAVRLAREPGFGQ